MSERKKVSGDPPKPKSRYPEICREVIADNLDGYYRWNAKRADEGDMSAALEMLHGFCEAVEGNAPIPDPIRHYLLMAFSYYLSNAKPIDKALNLVPPAHRPKGQFITFDPVRAVAMMYLYVKRDRMLKDEAKQATCVALHVEKRQLERADKALNLIRNWDVSGLEQAAQVVAPSRRGDRK